MDPTHCNLSVLVFPESSSMLMLTGNPGGVGGWVGAATSCAVAPLGHLCPGIGRAEQSVRAKEQMLIYSMYYLNQSIDRKLE